MRGRLFAAAGLALAAVGVIGIVQVPPAPITQPAWEGTAPQTSVVCQLVEAGTLLVAGDGALLAQSGTQEFEDPKGQLAQSVEALTVVDGIAPAGGIVGGGLFAPCQHPSTSGIVSWPSANIAELRLTNSDTSDASVDLRILGPDGEIESLGARDIALSPGQTRQVAVSVLAGGIEGPVAAVWSTSRGRVTAVGVTTGEVQQIAPTGQSAKSHMLVGQAKDGKPQLVLTNPGSERATAAVRFHASSSTFVPKNGESISIAPNSSVVVDLSAGTAGDIGAFTVTSDQPIAATLFSGKGTQLGASVTTSPSTKLRAMVPEGVRIQLSDPLETGAEVRVEVGGETQTVTLEPGTTQAIDGPKEGPVLVEMESNKPILAAAVSDNGAVVVPLVSVAQEEATAVNLQLTPSLH